MDSDRTIRYVTPPAFFYGNLLLGAWLADSGRVDALFKQDVPLLAGAVGASLFPIGFIIAGISTLILRLMFAPSKHSYEIALDDDAWARIWRSLKFGRLPEMSKMNRLNAAQTYDHELLPEKTHASAVRLWTAFNIAVHSCTALVLSVIVGHWMLHIHWSCCWVLITLLLGLLFGWIAMTTWQRHMAFLELQTRRVGEGACEVPKPQDQT